MRRHSDQAALSRCRSRSRRPGLQRIADADRSSGPRSRAADDGATGLTLSAARSAPMAYGPAAGCHALAYASFGDLPTPSRSSRPQTCRGSGRAHRQAWATGHARSVSAMCHGRMRSAARHRCRGAARRHVRALKAMRNRERIPQHRRQELAFSQRCDIAPFRLRRCAAHDRCRRRLTIAGHGVEPLAAARP